MHSWTIRQLIFLLVSLLPCAAYAQSVITGRVIDNSQQPIGGVAVTYSHVSNPIVLGYALTAEDGSFRLSITTSQDTVLLNLTHLGYERKQLRLENKTAHHTVYLNQEAQLLSTVVVSSPPVYQRNDTIHYNLETFTSKQDRVISDVIRKLPGIEMDGDKILYQGKPIQKYYINGLDLLEGRYGLANNNLPVEAVQKVQIIENDQPIKVLDSLVFSDRASLNIQLKKLTTTGTGKVGTGLQPALWEVNLTPMTFSKNFQTINTLQTNNTGDDVQRQLDVQTATGPSDITRQLPVPSMQAPSFMHVQRVAAPPFQERRWLENKTGLLSSNMLHKLGGGYELKGNISYVKDYQRRSGSLLTRLYTGEQEISFSEQATNTYKTDALRGEVILMKNDRDVYIKNNLRFSRNWQNAEGSLLRNSTTHIGQDSRLRDFSISNVLTSVKPIGGQLYSWTSHVGLSQSPQSLAVTPGLFENTLNDSVPYAQTQQSVQYRNFLADHHVSFVKQLGRLTFQPRVGLLYQDQVLQSQLSAGRSGRMENLGKPFGNSLQLQSTEVYAEVKTQFKSPKWKIEGDLPLRLRSYAISDRVFSVDKKYPLPTLEPKGTAIYSLNELWETRATSAYTRQVGGINTLYSGYLLTSYRNLQKFNASILQGSNWHNRLSLHYKNTYDAVFVNLHYSDSRQHRAYLFRNLIDPAGFNTIQVVEQANSRHTQALAGEASKFFQTIKTVVKINGNVNFSSSGYLFNDRLETMATKGYSAGVNLDNNSFQAVNFSYDIRMGLVRSSLSGRKLEDIVISNHSLNVHVFPRKDHVLTLTTEYYSTNLESQQRQIFTDLLYQLRIPNSKMDIELTCLNLWNTRTYARLYNTEFSIISNSYELRPRQLMVKAKFNF